MKINLSPRDCRYCESIVLPFDVTQTAKIGGGVDLFKNLSFRFRCVNCDRFCRDRIEFESSELALDAKSFVVSLGFADGNIYYERVPALHSR